MHYLAKSVMRNTAVNRNRAAHTPRKGPGEETAEDEEGLELPVNPDEGTPLIPDEEGVVTVPS